MTVTFGPPESAQSPLPVIEPLALSYGTAAVRVPASIKIIGVIGICIAVLGLLSAAYVVMSTIFSAVLAGSLPSYSSAGAMQVEICEAAVGGALAITLMAGSISLLKLRSSGRRLLLWWGWLYVATALIFLSLQIFVVIPSQISSMTALMAMTPATATTIPAISTTGPTTTTAMNFSTSVSVGAIATTAPAATAAVMPFSTLVPAINTFNIVIAVVKTAICLIFPIVMLGVLQLQTVRIAMTPFT